jgi:hypothetical protein
LRLLGELHHSGSTASFKDSTSDKKIPGVAGPKEGRKRAKPFLHHLSAFHSTFINIQLHHQWSSARAHLSFSLVGP